MSGRWVVPAVVASFAVQTDAAATPATGGRPAQRDISFDPTAACDIATAQLLASRHPSVRQFVIVGSDTWTATTGSVQVVAKSVGGDWLCQQGPATARLGKSGTRRLLDRRSGDGTTPAGVFPLGNLTAWDGDRFQFFGNLADPGVRGSYREVRPEDCWGATPNTPAYQHLVAAPGCTSPDEWLTRFGEVYGHAAVIGANVDPISGDAAGEPAFAAAIFLHRNAYATNGSSNPTAGCVSLPQDDLDVALRLIDPALDVRFAIGPWQWLRDAA
jgi:L,D-peptidoglycan transpeptidase YkuD (ErfK/YbiS/YcfS/YnhG family)